MSEPNVNGEAKLTQLAALIVCPLLQLVRGPPIRHTSTVKVVEQLHNVTTHIFILENTIHYTPVLPVLFLSGGRHLLQDEFTNCGILGFTNRGILENSTVKITPVGDKPGYLEKQYSQDAPVSEPAKTA